MPIQDTNTRKLHLRKLSREQLGNAGSAPGESQSGPEGPPACITGGQLAEERKLGISLDWESFTVNLSAPKEVQQKIGGEWTKRKGGFLGYPASAESSLGEVKIVMGYGKHQAPGEIHVSISGQACRALGYEKLQELTRWAQEEKQGRVTRLDVAFDDFSGQMTVDKVDQARKEGQCVKRSKSSRRYTEVKEVKGKEIVTGDGVYFGKRESETFIRCYNKRLEQEAKGKEVKHEHWTRIEVEYKGERANAVAGVFKSLPADLFAPVAVSYLCSSLDFVQATREDEDWERSRAPRVEWWQYLTEGMKRVRIAMEKPVFEIKKTLEWLQGAVMPMLLSVCAHPQLGQQWLLENIVGSHDRWKAKHRAFVAAPLPSAFAT